VTPNGAYAYRALRRDGSVERGTLSVHSQADALAALEQKGLLAMEVSRAAATRDPRAALSASDLALGLRILADLFEAGLPMTRSLQTFGELAPASWQTLLPHLKQSVREGKSLGAALRDAPAEIPPLVIGMTLAGEMAGNVGSAVRRAADVTESIAETQAAIRGALAYPLVLASAGTGAIALMIGVVIPRFAAILGDLGQSLPSSTRLVLASATAIRAAFLPAISAGVVLAVALRTWTASETGRLRWHGILLRVPLIGTVRRASATARATFTLATLLETGVPLRQAIPFAARASGDAAMNARVVQAGLRIEGGQPIARALRDTDAMTPLALRLIQAGEESGRLAAMLRHSAKLEQQRSDRLTRVAVRLLEPVLILIFAGVVALVAAALLQAVYSVRPTV
jgi:general secretion pathway protein F